MSKTLFVNDRVKETAAIFEKLGGEFVCPPQELAQKIKNIKAFIFDWDGVFNDGRKGPGKTSDFAEADTMALHTIRYAYWKLHGNLPVIAIVTGQNNPSAFELAEREHLTAVFAGYKDKFEPLEILKNEFGLQNNQLASTFDDIIDYPLMVSTHVRFLCRRNASPLFTDYLRKNELCDYITYSEQPNFPVREISELVIGFWGNYDEMFISRFRDKDIYKTYWELRQSVEPKIYKK